MKKFPEMAEKSWNFQKLSQSSMKIKEFLEFQAQNQNHIDTLQM